MKKTMIVVVLAVAMLATMSGIAYAGYATPDPNVDEQWAAHSGFAATTNYCKQCHDVHGGVMNTDNTPLWRYGTVTDVCYYCHVGGAAMSGDQVYGDTTFEAEHTIGATNVPDAAVAGPTHAGLGSDDKLGCFDCHDAAPHGAGATSSGWGSGGALITTTKSFGTAYCGGCHDLNDGGALGGGGSDTTHPIVSSVTDATVAFGASQGCISCHDSTLANGFPHQTNGYAMLQDTALLTGGIYPLDDICMTCHPNVGTLF